ncbi:hypothetical protein ACO1O0_004062 [Amphichorda felina]
MSMLRGFMSAKVRSNAGCWTCRLRRKKCDERRPVCDACSALEITCHFEDEKPVWMDGGARQKDMATSIKAQVKKQASQRRDRRYMEMLESGTRVVRLGAKDSDKPSTTDGASRAEIDTDPSSQTSGNESGSTPPSSRTSGASPRIPPQVSPQIPWTSSLLEHQGEWEDEHDGAHEADVHFIMIYLDYIFPYLFPFYRPPVLSGGRGWVLDILQSNKSVYYTAISLAAYFFGVLLSSDDEEHEECMTRMARKLQHELELGLRELQKEMLRINNSQDGSNIEEQLIVMQGIAQMVVFEVTTSNGDNWKVHLDAAIALFFQILPKPDRWAETLERLYTARWPPPSMGLKRPWSTKQAALRFFTANLFNMDVMSSISLERQPRLREYQDDLIPGCYSDDCGSHTQEAGPLFMNNFVGLHNWIIQMIGNVATLAAWKKDSIKAGTFQTADLLSRSQILVDGLQTSLEVLDSRTDVMDPRAIERIAWIVEDPLTELRVPRDHGIKELQPAEALYNRIWLHGVIVYLYTIIFGWQPEHESIKKSVTALTELFVGLPRGTCLRGMVFPFCVAGCLSPPEDEDKYRHMVNRLGPLRVFGTVKDASEIMEKVWSRRDQIDETWDVAKCLRILGHATLLI